MTSNLWIMLHSGRECWFLGQAAAQFYIDFYIWELFFLQYKIKNMVELGTGQGAGSLFFLLQSIQKDFYFNTFDINTPGYLTSPLAKLLCFEDHFYQGNIWEDQNDRIIYLLSNDNYPTLLYCDNGTKAKEADIFGRYLKPDDYLVIHDWGTEVTRGDISDLLKDFDEILVEECNELGSLTKFFVKRG
jgi:hypothetical protein